MINVNSFSGLCHLYQYYDGMVQTDDESKLKTEQESSFVDFKSTIKTLFWAIFCMSPVESADVIIENLPGERESETIINSHSFTEFIGYLSFGSKCTCLSLRSSHQLNIRFIKIGLADASRINYYLFRISQAFSLFP